MFGHLFAYPNYGLADLAKESTVGGDDITVDEEDTYYNRTDWEDTVPILTPEISVLGGDAA